MQTRSRRNKDRLKSDGESIYEVLSNFISAKKEFENKLRFINELFTGNNKIDSNDTYNSLQKLKQ